MHAMNKKFIILFVLFYSLFFTTCNLTFDASVKKYIEDCTKTCKVAGIEIMTEHHLLNTGENISAEKPVEFYIYPINHKNYELLQKPEGVASCFKMTYEGSDESIALEEKYENGIIKITASLEENMEGKKITLSGCLWPENYKNLPENQLHASHPELFVNETYIQNTPPDYVTNLEGTINVLSNSANLSFKIPEQTKVKNQDAFYDINYYIFENGKKVSSNSKEIKLQDGTINDGYLNYTFYFKEGELKSNKQYTIDYTVKVKGFRTLESRVISTNDEFGTTVVKDPSIKFSQSFNGLTDNNNYEYIELNSDSATVTFQIKSEEGSHIQGTIDGKNFSSNTNIYNSDNLSKGNHTITITALKEGSLSSNTITRKIAIVKTLDAPEIKYNGVENGNNIEYSILDNPGCTVSITNKAEQGSSISVTIDAQTIDNISNYSLSDGEHYLKIIISKTGHKEVKIEKTINVSFKPVTVRVNKGYSQGALCVYYDDYDDEAEICGKIYITKNQDPAKLLREFVKADFKENEWDTYNIEDSFTCVLYDKGDFIWYFSENIQEDDVTTMNEIEEVSETYWLSDIANYVRTYQTGQYLIEVTSSDNYLGHRLWLYISD